MANNKTVVIAGGSGLIGQAALAELIAADYHVRILTRDRNSHPADGAEYCLWGPGNNELDPAHLKDARCIINLTGYPVDSGRWTEKRKKRIRDSRVLSSRLLVRTILNNDLTPECFISGSAIGFYDDDPAGTYDESAPPGTHFLAHVCRKNEDECDALTDKGIRLVKLRTGVVLSRGGGAFKRLLPIFKFGLGAIIGNGKQGFPWIHVDDMAAIVRFIIENNAIRGPVNAVAPDHGTNESFSRHLAAALNRPCFFRIPPFALKFIFGEFAATLTRGGTVIPAVLQNNNYNYHYPGLPDCLKSLRQ